MNGELNTDITAQKMKFSIKDFFSKCDQIHRKLRIWSHLLKKSLMENFIFEQCMFVKSTDIHQLLDPASSHPYHCKKGIPYSQALRLNRISSDNENFDKPDKRCNDLEKWLMEGYNEKMIRK